MDELTDGCFLFTRSGQSCWRSSSPLAHGGFLPSLSTSEAWYTVVGSVSGLGVFCCPCCHAAVVVLLGIGHKTGTARYAVVGSVSGLGVFRWPYCHAAVAVLLDIGNLTCKIKRM